LYLQAPHAVFSQYGGCRASKSLATIAWNFYNDVRELMPTIQSRVIMNASPKDSKWYRIKSRVLRTVEQTIRAHAMLQLNDSVLLGISGGPDSVALLHVLAELAPQYELKLGVAHLNHSLRGLEADADADFVSTLALRFDLPCYLQKRDIRTHAVQNKLSIEDAARQVRYMFFDEIAKKHGFNKIAVGHQANDNAEQVLMYLLRGSGPQGLSGIPPIRDEKIIRPLSRLTRKEIENYLAANRLDYVTDRSNTDTKFIRNRIRHQLLPQLMSSYNPRLIETLNRLAEITRCDEQWIKDIIKLSFDDVCVGQDAGRVTLSVSALNRLQIAARRRIMRMAVAAVKGDLRRVTFDHIQAALRLLEKGSTPRHLDFPDCISIQREGDALVVQKQKSRKRPLPIESHRSDYPFYNYAIPAPGAEPLTIEIKETGLQLQFSRTRSDCIPDIRNTGQQVAFFDMTRLRFPLTLRNFQPGDRFTPLGMTGSQKVKDFFIDRKIPRSDRRMCPLLVSLGKIIWVVGDRIDESVKVTDKTTNILKAKLLLAE
jgi:tRNA(Ile)-lysidine synthase